MWSDCFSASTNARLLWDPNSGPTLHGGGGRRWAEATSKTLHADPPPLSPAHRLLQVPPRRPSRPFPRVSQPGGPMPECHRLFLSAAPHATRLPAPRQPAAVPASPTSLALLTARAPQPGALAGNPTHSDPSRYEGLGHQWAELDWGRLGTGTPAAIKLGSWGSCCKNGGTGFQSCRLHSGAALGRGSGFTALSLRLLQGK